VPRFVAFAVLLWQQILPLTLLYSGCGQSIDTDPETGGETIVREGKMWHRKCMNIKEHVPDQSTIEDMNAEICPGQLFCCVGSSSSYYLPKVLQTVVAPLHRDG